MKRSKNKRQGKSTPAQKDRSDTALQRYLRVSREYLANASSPSHMRSKTLYSYSPVKRPL